MCKFDEVRFSNPGDYDVNSCNFWDDTTNIDIFHQIWPYVRKCW